MKTNLTNSQLEEMRDALQDAMYKLEVMYNHSDDRTTIMWHLEQLTKIENLLINLQND
jgi:hypothetical protein